MYRGSTWFVLFVLLFFSCTNGFQCLDDKIRNSRDVNPDAIFFDYTVWGEEGREEVTIKIQYRMGGPNGTSLILDEPSKVELDGEHLVLDSAKLTGAYYEIQRPLEDFSGRHAIIFTDLNKKKYREDFEFVPFTIQPDVPATISRGAIVLSLKGLDTLDFVRVVLTDTSFASDDINDIDSVKNGRLELTAERLSTLHSGPINLEIWKEIERPLKSGTREGGRIFINYGVKRQFELKD